MACKLQINNAQIAKVLGKSEFKDLDEFQNLLYEKYVKGSNAIPISVNRKSAFLKLSLTGNSSIRVAVRAPLFLKKEQLASLTGIEDIDARTQRSKYSIEIPAVNGNPDLDTFLKLWMGNYLSPTPERVRALNTKGFKKILETYRNSLKVLSEKAIESAQKSKSRAIDSYESKNFIDSIIGPNGLIVSYFKMDAESLIPTVEGDNATRLELEKAYKELMPIIDEIKALTPTAEYVLEDPLKEYTKLDEYNLLENKVDSEEIIAAKFLAVKSLGQPSQKEDSDEIDNYDAAKAVLMNLVNKDKSRKFRVRYERDSMNYVQNLLKSGTDISPMPLKFINSTTSVVAIIEVEEGGVWKRVYLKDAINSANTLSTANLKNTNARFELTTDLNQAYSLKYQIDNEGVVETLSSPQLTLRIDSIEGFLTNKKVDPNKKLLKEKFSKLLSEGKIVYANIQKTDIYGKNYLPLDVRGYSISDIKIETSDLERGIPKIGNEYLIRGVLPQDMKQEVIELLEKEYFDISNAEKVVEYLNALIGVGDFIGVTPTELQKSTNITNRGIGFEIHKNPDGSHSIMSTVYRYKEGTAFVPNPSAKPLSILTPENKELISKALDAARINIPKNKSSKSTRVGEYPQRFKVVDGDIETVKWTTKEQHEFILKNVKTHLTKVDDSDLVLDRVLFTANPVVEDPQSTIAVEKNLAQVLSPDLITSEEGGLSAEELSQLAEVDSIGDLSSEDINNALSTSFDINGEAVTIEDSIGEVPTAPAAPIKDEYDLGNRLSLNQINALITNPSELESVYLELAKLEFKDDVIFVVSDLSKAGRLAEIVMLDNGATLSNKEAGLVQEANQLASSNARMVIRLNRSSLINYREASEEKKKAWSPLLKAALMEEMSHAFTVKKLKDPEVQESKEYKSFTNVIQQARDLYKEGKLNLTPEEEKEFAYRVGSGDTISAEQIAEFIATQFTINGKSILNKLDKAGLVYDKKAAGSLIKFIENLLKSIHESVAKLLRKKSPSLEERISIDALALSFNKFTKSSAKKDTTTNSTNKKTKDEIVELVSESTIEGPIPTGQQPTIEAVTQPESTILVVEPSTLSTEEPMSSSSSTKIVKTGKKTNKSFTILGSLTPAFSDGFETPESTAEMFKNPNIIKSFSDHADMIASYYLWDADAFPYFVLGRVASEDVINNVKDGIQEELNNPQISNSRKNLLTYAVNNLEKLWLENSELFKLKDESTNSENNPKEEESADESGEKPNVGLEATSNGGDKASGYEERTEQKKSSIEEIGKYARAFTRMIPKIQLENGVPVFEEVEVEDENGKIIKVKEPKFYRDALGNLKPADYTSLWNATADVVAGSLTFEEMIGKLSNTFHKIPEMGIFLERMESLTSYKEALIVIKDLERSLQKYLVPTKIVVEKKKFRYEEKGGQSATDFKTAEEFFSSLESGVEDQFEYGDSYSIASAIAEESIGGPETTASLEVPADVKESMGILGDVVNYGPSSLDEGADVIAETFYDIYDSGRIDAMNVKNILIGSLRKNWKSLQTGTKLDYKKLADYLDSKVTFNKTNDSATVESVLKMWEELGLIIPSNVPPGLKSAAKDRLTEFTRAFSNILISLKNKDIPNEDFYISGYDIFELVRTGAGVEKGQPGIVKDLLGTLVDILPYATSNMTKNAEGENQSNLHNYSSYLLNVKYINQMGNVSDEQMEGVYKMVPRLKNPIAKYSWTLERVKEGKKLSPVNVSGTTTDTRGVNTINLDLISYVRQTMETLLTKGFKENIRAETASSSFGFEILSNKVELPIEIEQDVFKRTESLMRGYFKGELERIFNERKADITYSSKYNRIKKEFTFLRDVLPTDLQNEIYSIIDSNLDKPIKNVIGGMDGFGLLKDLMPRFNQAVEAYVIKEREDFKNYILEETGAPLTFDHPILVSNGIQDIYSRMYNNPNIDRIDALVDLFVMNGNILGIEEIILFHGEIGQFDKFYKRSKSNISNGTSVVINERMQEFFKESLPNRTFSEVISGKRAEYYENSSEVKSILLEEDLMVTTPAQAENLKKGIKESLKQTAIAFGKPVNESEIEDRAQKTVDGYGKMVEGKMDSPATVGDGEGVIHPDAYRMFLWGVGSWTPEMEEGFEYLAIKYKVKKGIELSEKEAELLKKVEDKIQEKGYYFQFPKIKFQYRGPGKQVMQIEGQENEIEIDTPTSIEMLDKFALTPLFPELCEGSAAEDLLKVMSERSIGYAKFPSATKLGAFETNKLKDLKEGAELKGVHKILTPYMKEQVKTPVKIKEVSLFGSQQRKLVISNLFANGKFLPKLEKFYDMWVGSQRTIADNARKQLMKDIGAKRVNGKLEIDMNKLLPLLREEVDKRDLPDSLRYYFDREVKPNEKVFFEMSLSPKIVENMLYSMLKNRIVKAKFPGSQLVQVASSVFNRIDSLNENNRDLEFYRVDENGNILPAQCKITLHGPFLNLLNLPEVQEKGGNREALNALLKDPEFRKKHQNSLTVYSYRIPTQGFNSMDILEIKEFLPEYMSNTLIPPPQIVVKSGTDYDYDKMPTVYPSIDKSGNYIGVNNTNASLAALSKEDFENLKKEKLNIINERVKAFSLKASESSEKLAEFKAKGITPLTLDKATEDERGQATQLFKERKVFLKANLETLKLAKSSQIEKVKELEYFKDKTIDYKTRAEKYAEKFNGNKLNISTLNLLITKNVDQLKNLNNQLTLTKAELSLYASIKEDSNLSEELIDLQKSTEDYYKLLRSRDENAIESNKLIEAARGILLDPTNFHRLVTPNSTDIVVPTIQKILEKLYNTTGQVNPDPTNTKVYSFTTHLKKWSAVKIKDLLGIAAVNNTFYALMQEAGMSFNKEFNINEVDFKVTTPLLTRSELENLDLSNPFIVGTEIDKLEIINQFINLFVDAASNDIAGYTNMVKENVSFVLLQTVMGVPLERTLAFLHQPIIYQYRQYIAKEKASGVPTYIAKKNAYQKFLGISPLNVTEDGIFPKKKSQIWYEIRTKLPLSTMSEKNLFDRLSSREEIPFMDFNYSASKGNTFETNVLAYYIMGLEMAEGLRKVQSHTNYDTTPAQSYKASQLRENLAAELEETGLFPEESINTLKSGVTAHLNIHEELKEISNLMFPIKNEPLYVYRMTKLVEDLPSYEQEKTLNTLDNNFLLYVIQNYSDPSFFNQEKYEHLLSLMNEGALMDRWEQLKEKYNLYDTKLGTRLIPISDKFGNANPATFTGLDSDPNEFNAIKRQIEDMLNMQGNDEMSIELRTFATDLVDLGFFQTGYQPSAISLHKVLPPEYTENFRVAFENFSNLPVETKEKEYDRFLAMYSVKESKLAQKLIPSTLLNYIKDTEQSVIDFPFKAEEQGQITVEPTLDLSKQWSGDLESRPVYTSEGVNTMRTSAAKLNEHFGNPFSATGYEGTRKVPSIETAIKAYKEWLLTGYASWLNEEGEAQDFAGAEEQRAWILTQINQGKLDNANLLYDKKLAERGKGTHAEALIEVVKGLRQDKSALKTLGTLIPTTPVKEGVVELFEENKELANAVYETLGFSNIKENIADSEELLVVDEKEIPKKEGESFSEMQKRISQNQNIKKRIETASKNNIVQGNAYSYSEIKKIFNNDKLFDNEIYKQLNSILESSNLTFRFGSLNKGKKSINAYYNATSNSINIDTLVLNTPNLATSDFKRILLHEIIHAATFINLKEGAKLTSVQKTALNNLNNLLVELRKDKEFFGQYGLTNANELLAELSNKEFVDKLKNKTFDKDQSFFEKIVSEVVKLLGLNTTAYDIVKESFDNLVIDFEIPTQVSSQQKQQAQQIYSAYLDSIFPGSQVKNIVYHSTPHYGYNKFSRINIGTSDRSGIAGFDFLRSSAATKRYLKGEFIQGKTKGTYAVVLNATKLESYQTASLEKEKGVEIINSLLNDKFISEETHKRLKDYIESSQNVTGNVYSGTLLSQIFTNTRMESNIENAEKAIAQYINLTGINTYYQGKTPLEQTQAKITVFDPEQIHILGNKSDIEGFKEYVSKQAETQTQTQPEEETLCKTPNLRKDDSSNIPF